MLNADANVKIVKGIQETLGSIRDIILNNLASHYTSTHKKTEYSMRKLMSQNIFLTFFPRYLLETLSLNFNFSNYFIEIKYI